MDIIQLSSLDICFADFVTRIEGKDREGLWLAAALVSFFTCRGHVCVELAGIAGSEVVTFKPERESLKVPSADIWQEMLSSCNTVGRSGEYTPLVLDADGRLYLHRSWDAERRLAEGILCRSTRLVCDDSRLSTVLDRYFPPDGGGPDLQREAAQAALTRQFTVVSGGPGTGKTATVTRILALLIEQAENGVPVIFLAAPTGKAAMRLKQSLALSAGMLPLSDAVRSVLPREVTTIHRLLGAMPGRSGGRHHRDNPLPCDVLVVDEASMVDLPLMTRLLEALRTDTRVILLGDSDQLASVEAGAVLSDICSGSSPDGLSGHGHPAIVHLTKSYRFPEESGIGRLSRLINTGDGEAVLDLLRSGLYPDVCWRVLPSAGVFAGAFVDSALQGYAAFVGAVSPIEGLEVLDHFRVLAPHREGRHGVRNLNRLTESALYQPLPAGLPARHQKPVIITSNNYDLGLYNGDTGIMSGTIGEEGAVVYFPTPESGEGVRRIATLRLPRYETAFALTVHKAQGSEFDKVMLILPDQMSEVLSRELLYTAVTRARKRIEIWGDEDVVRQVVERRTERNSGLRDRLWK